MYRTWCWLGGGDRGGGLGGRAARTVELFQIPSLEEEEGSVTPLPSTCQAKERVDTGIVPSCCVVRPSIVPIVCRRPFRNGSLGSGIGGQRAPELNQKFCY